MLHSIRQFIEALQDPYGLTRTLGEIEVCRSSDGEPLRWVGNSAVVFKIRCGSRYKMLKCYTRPMEHLEAIYQEKLLRQELYVWQADGQGEWCDVVVDDWIEGITLYEAVMRGAGSGDKAHLSNLARQFDRLALELLESDWAHGDLKPENILLDESGTLRPVDFDAMFLPVFAGEKSPELGTAAYQHPGRTAEDFDASIDDYSIATISTTLHALALEPGLLARYNRGEGLLLSPREIVRHGCAAHAECLALFEKAGDAVRYRIARLLESPLMRLPNLKPLVRYAVCGPETPADRGELFVRDGLWGFKIRERELIPPIYDAGFDFSEGLAAVRTERCWHFIDPTGAVAIDCSDCNAVNRSQTAGRSSSATDNVWPSAARNPEPPCIFDGEQLSLSEEYLFRQGCFAAIRKINFRLPVALTIFAKDRRRLGQVRTTDGRSEAEGTRELCHAKKETKRDVWLAVHLSLSLT